MEGHSEQIQWLLEDHDPMVRYNTLTRILERPAADPEVRESLHRMLNASPVSNVLRKQNADGGFVTARSIKQYGEERAHFGYLPKHKATTWQAAFLAQAGVPAADQRIQALGEFILAHTYNGEMGVFGRVVQTDRGLRKRMMPCLNARMVWALCTLGFGYRAEVRNSFQFLAQQQRFDDGDFKPTRERPFDWVDSRYCWGPASCFAGASGFVLTFPVVPDDYWNPVALQAKERAIAFLLEHRILHRTLKPGSKAPVAKNAYRLGKPESLLSLQAPLTGADAIEIVTALLLLGVRHAAIDETIDRILAEANDRGRWILGAAPSSMYGSWGKVGEENRWVTFRVLRMLKLAGRL